MIRTMRAISDKLVARVLPQVTASATTCGYDYRESTCAGSPQRYTYRTCYQNCVTGVITCGAWTRTGQSC